MAEPTITVEIVHAGVERLWRERVTVPAGATVLQALHASGLLERLPRAAIKPLRLGIYARRVDGDRVLRDGERIEIYRPLTLDPMAARRQRASRA